MTLEVTFGIDDDDEEPVKLAAANEPVIMLEEVVLGRWSSWSIVRISSVKKGVLHFLSKGSIQILSIWICEKLRLNNEQL